MSGRVALQCLLFAFGAVCYALLGILSQLSKEEDGSYAYSMPSVVFVAEVVKLGLSMGYLSCELRSPLGAFRLLKSTSRLDWLRFCVPSMLYAWGNNLDMLNNQYMDPATEQVLVQLKVLTTGVVWRLVFREPLPWRKWGALLLLGIGGAGAGWPSTPTGTETNTMYIKPFGALLVCLHSSCSACAGVYNEWLYKRAPAKGDSIHLANARLYVIGSLFNFAMHAATAPSGPRPDGLLRGYNRYVWGLVVVYALMGLLLAQVMKFFNVIVKLFISGSSMYVSAFLTWFLFGYTPSALFVASLGVVSVAILVFNAEKIWLPKAKDA